MQENAKCFIKVKKNIYEEITYKELEERRKKSSFYTKKKFIYIHGMLLEVSENEYKDYFKEIERNRYSKKVLQKLGTVSIDKLKNDENIKHKEIIFDDGKDIEFEIERKMEIEQLKKALMQLPVADYKLIRALFYDEKTLREYAKIMGVSYVAIQHKKMRILKKIKKFLKI